jgi:hypothetical protein
MCTVSSTCDFKTRRKGNWKGVEIASLKKVCWQTCSVVELIIRDSPRLTLLELTNEKSRYISTWRPNSFTTLHGEVLWRHRREVGLYRAWGDLQ